MIFPDDYMLLNFFFFPGKSCVAIWIHVQIGEPKFHPLWQF